MELLLLIREDVTVSLLKDVVAVLSMCACLGEFPSLQHYSPVWEWLNLKIFPKKRSRKQDRTKKSEGIIGTHQAWWAAVVKSPTWLSTFTFTFHVHALEKAMATHSSTLAWRLPWMEEPGRLQSVGSRRVQHNWATSLSFFTFIHWRRKWHPTPVFSPRESQGRGSLVGCRLWVHTESDTTEVT